MVNSDSNAFAVGEHSENIFLKCHLSVLEQKPIKEHVAQFWLENISHHNATRSKRDDVLIHICNQNLIFSQLFKDGSDFFKKNVIKAFINAQEIT